MRLIPTLLVLTCACTTLNAVVSKPPWHGEAAGAVDCQRWSERSAQEAPESRWSHRALWRWSRCLLKANADPRPALLAMIQARMPEGYLSDAIAEAMGSDALSVELRQAIVVSLDGRVTGEPAAAVAWGHALLLPEDERTGALRNVIAVDPKGWRGRRARVLLADRASPEEAALLFEAALKPHRGVISSLGHSEFGGSLETAERWLSLCRKHPELACEQRAYQRRSELAK